MWPWTHALFGYVCYSLAVRAGFRHRPTDSPAVLAVFAAVAPDLVDKPLAWTFGVTASGYGPAHSILLGVPVAALAAVWTWHALGRESGAAVVIGYGSHLLGDIIFQFFDEGELVLSVVLWPVVAAGPDSQGGMLSHLVHFTLRYIAQIRAGAATAYFLGSTLLAAATVALWVADGTPGVGLLTRDR